MRRPAQLGPRCRAQAPRSPQLRRLKRPRRPLRRIRRAHSRNATAPRLPPVSHQFARLIRTVRHRSEVADFTAPFALRNLHRNRRLVDIQPDERAILHLVSSPFLRLGARKPGATLERRMPRERPQTQSVHTAIMGSKGGYGEYALLIPPKGGRAHRAVRCIVLTTVF